MDPKLFTISKLYRDCLRLADYLGSKQGNREQLRNQIRVSFRATAGETDPVKIEEAKEAAVRGLSNFMFFEAARMAKQEAEEKGMSAVEAAKKIPFRFVAEDSPEFHEQPSTSQEQEDDSDDYDEAEGGDEPYYEESSSEEEEETEDKGTGTGAEDIRHGKTSQS